jgi:succinate dehydrogenase / fumarate reductase flavoprotein subunit
MRNKKIDLNEKLRKVSCDILVIGGGGAGLRAAIGAHDSGADVLIISKSQKGDPHTVLATGGINGALATMNPNDNWMIHAADTLKEECFLADYEKVMTLCKNAPEAILELVKWGARFHKEPDGRLTQRFFGAHTYRRTCFFGDQTGKEIIRVLMKQVKKRKLKFADNIFITRILKKNDQVAGALGIDFKKKGLVIFQSKCIILAGGGYSRVYSVSSSRDFENYGEGVALAYEAGAELADMEMVQFHPSGMVWPKKAIGILATEAIRGEGGMLFNAKNERFMKLYDPERMELGPRDEVARAIYNEIALGRGTKHGGVWLDVTLLPRERILKRLPKMYQQFKELAEVDITKERMEVAPTAHYSMGGVKTDLEGRTAVKGLFAVGEVTSQVHGANRLGGNSLVETLVFGKIVGKAAAEFSKQIELETFDVKDATEDLFLVKDAVSIRMEIQKTMCENVDIIRDATKMIKALDRIRELEQVFDKSKIGGLKMDENLKRTLELRAMLTVSEAIVRSALLRKESRGAHYRSDFQRMDDDNWKVSIICRNEEGEMKIFTEKVKPIGEALKKMVVQETRRQYHYVE